MNSREFENEKSFSFDFENGIDFFNVEVTYETDFEDIDVGNPEETYKGKIGIFMQDISIHDHLGNDVTSMIRMRSPELFEEILGEACLTAENMEE